MILEAKFGDDLFAKLKLIMGQVQVINQRVVNCQ